MDWNKMEWHANYDAYSRRRSNWDQKRIQGYQVRMRRRPTRAEKRFKKIIYQYFGLNPCKLSSGYRKKASRSVVCQKMMHDTRHDRWYIADFYLPKHRIIFEIDGPNHSRSSEYDAIRSSFMATRGIKVFRISNKDTKNKQKTLNFITNAINDKLKSYQPAKINVSREQELKLQQEYILHHGVTKCPTKWK